MQRHTEPAPTTAEGLAPIRIRGARQNNLRNLDLDIPTGELVVITGVSGSGKSSLAFDTLYAEGQRRYVETFSAYARQFLDRMDKPQVDRIDGVPPAIAIDQTNPVRTSRSTVGTMTELNDHLKLLFARTATLHCRHCAQPVRRNHAQSIAKSIRHRAAAAGDPRIVVTFEVAVPANFGESEVEDFLNAQGFTRIQRRRPVGDQVALDVVADRFRVSTVDGQRLAEAIESALRHGNGRLTVFVLPDGTGSADGLIDADAAAAAGHAAEAAPAVEWKFSDDFRCADCDIGYTPPSPSLFSFNSPIGACPSCRGFGRVIGVDLGLVIPDQRKSLGDGAVRPWQTASFKECQQELEKYARRAGIALDIAWRDLPEEHRRWVIDGAPDWTGDWRREWYGIHRFFAWLESRAYKMHVRVLLSKYRAYSPCTLCHGARLRHDALLWRAGEGVADGNPDDESGSNDSGNDRAGDGRDDAGREDAGRYLRFMPPGVDWSRDMLEALPGLTVHDLMLMPVDALLQWFARIELPRPLDEATVLLLQEIRTRLRFLQDVGLGYLTLDRQSRTLSGGEVQRINLTTALGTSLVNTLFVLDEPSIGLHPRDMARVIDVMHRLRDAGNSLVVVEHDPQVMFAADRIIDIGPGPGERGGNIVFNGPAGELATAGTLTADYLAQRRLIATDAARAVSERTPKLLLLGAREHNLKHVDVTIPLGHLVCLTGVSGSGKSTLMQDVLLPALNQQFGKGGESPGAFDSLLGHEWLKDVVFVDQSPIGKTARSNPASYVGAFDPIRKRFAEAAVSRERGYTAGTFSFNAGDGRCPTCGGNGFEHVEMQFLSDVWLRCADCNGERYRPEILEVRIDGRANAGANDAGDASGAGGAGGAGGANDGDGTGRAASMRSLSVSQVLDLTVHEALTFFADDAQIKRRLAPLVDVGLDYLKLGQPVPTLSGGEAQRLKLAGFLAEAAERAQRPLTGPGATRSGGKGRAGSKVAKSSAAAAPVPHGAHIDPLTGQPRGGTLFLFDEPTTGLHFDDVARLLRALRKLVDAGNSLLVIEHNLDLIRASDWVIDLGPDGGERGGYVVATGTPDDLAQRARRVQADQDAPQKQPGRPGASVPVSPTGAALADYARGLDAMKALAGRPRADAAPAGTIAAEPAGPMPMVAAEPVATSSSSDGVPLQQALRQRASHSIFVHRARENNLKDIDIEVPREKMTVITGVSGSGKSTLAFDVIFGEGQRRYLESLNAYARQFVQPATRPDVEGVFGIPPTVAIEQRTSRGGRKSTVATLTEVHHFLRVLYQKLGIQYCPKDGTRIEPQSFDAIFARLMREHRGRTIGLLAPLVVGRKGIYTDLAKWADARGYTHLRVDRQFVPVRGFPKLDRYVEHDIELPVADIAIEPANEALLREKLRLALDLGKGVVMVIDDVAPLRDALDSAVRTSLHSTSRACSTCGTSYPEPDPRLFSFNSKHGWCPSCLGAGLQVEGRIKTDELTPGLEGATDAGVTYTDRPCPTCEGRRLNPVALAVRIGDKSIADLSALPIEQALPWIERLSFDDRGEEIARDLLDELRSRLRFLMQVGLGYLGLDRGAPTLSGGEAQRIRLAGQLGSNLQGVCYVLDEPTIGLHPRDNRILLDTLEALRDKGNTLLVVEHDEDTMARADHLIDIGPGAGRLGGQVVATGSRADLEGSADSLTGRYLREPLMHPLHERRVVTGETPAIRVSGANLHNLHDAAARFPLHRLTVVTGVSGSGKSTLARDVLLDALAGRVGRASRAERRTGGSDAFTADSGATIEGWSSLQRVLEVDQTPIGKTPRSTPATYIGFWDAIRRAFAETGEARLRGYGAGRFSFNTAGGRCEACEGQGMRTIEMNFLPDVKVRCDVCEGRRFDHETQQVLLNGKSIGDVLLMSVDEALVHFESWRSIAHPLKLLQDVGLGYLTIGQASPTLSGGEAQRIKLVTELSKVRELTEVADPVRKARESFRAGGAKGGTLYVLDEPTVGLHMADVARLIDVMHRLTDAGNTLVVIEHHLDVWAEADWIVDLGPEGGDGGGRVVAEGSPEVLARDAQTHTGQALAAFLAERRIDTTEAGR